MCPHDPVQPRDNRGAARVPATLDHPHHEERLGALLVHEAPGHVTEPRCGQYVEQPAPGQQLGERRPIGFGHEHRQRQNGPDSRIALQRALQLPQMFIRIACVEPLAILAAYGNVERTAAAVLVHQLEAAPHFGVRAEVIEQGRIGVEPQRADSGCEARHQDQRGEPTRRHPRVPADRLRSG
jgi:hypothetical protein